MRTLRKDCFENGVSPDETAGRSRSVNPAFTVAGSGMEELLRCSEVPDYRQQLCAARLTGRFPLVPGSFLRAILSKINNFSGDEFFSAPGLRTARCIRRGLLSGGRDIGDCGLNQVQHVLQSLSTLVRWAHHESVGWGRTGKIAGVSRKGERRKQGRIGPNAFTLDHERITSAPTER